MRRIEVNAAALARAYGKDLSLRDHHSVIIEAFTTLLVGERQDDWSVDDDDDGSSGTPCCEGQFIEMFQSMCQPGWEG